MATITTNTITFADNDQACYALRRRERDDWSRQYHDAAIRHLVTAGWTLGDIEMGALRKLEERELLSYSLAQCGE